MLSISKRVTLIVAAGTFVAILFPTVAAAMFISPYAMDDAAFRRALTVGVLLLAVTSLMIGRLAAAAAVRPLVDTTERLESLAVGLSAYSAPRHQPTEIARLADAVEVLVKAANERNALHTAAVGALAHDVRTSLAAVLVAVENSREGPSEERFDPATVAAIESELRRVQRLTGDLVVMMRRDLGDRQLNSRVEIAVLVAAIVESVRFHSEVRLDLVVTRPFSRDLPLGLLERALRNLIENAVSAAKTSVLIEIVNGAVIIADDGPGLPAGLLAAYEGGRAHYGVHSDHGYGFAIAVKLVEMCGGHLVIQRSSAEGACIVVYV